MNDLHTFFDTDGNQEWTLEELKIALAYETDKAVRAERDTSVVTPLPMHLLLSILVVLCLTAETGTAFELSAWVVGICKSSSVALSSLLV